MLWRFIREIVVIKPLLVNTKYDYYAYFFKLFHSKKISPPPHITIYEPFSGCEKIVLRDNTLLFSTIFANENKHFIEDFGRGKKDTVFGKRAIGK